MSTKSSLISQLSALPVTTLQRLLDYSSLLIVPEEDLLVNATMSQMYDKAMELADTYFPQWTDRSSGDFGRFIIELICLFSEKDFWYVNALANEGFLQKATVYSNVYFKALQNGYIGSKAKCALKTYQVVFSPGSEILIPPGTIKLSSKGITFTNAEKILIPLMASSYSVNIPMYAGIYATQSESYNGVSVRITFGGVDVRFVTLSVNGSEWTQVDTFSQSSSADKHFMCLPDSDGSVEIIFGSGGYGSQPSLGTDITASYMYGGGTSGNVLIDTAPVLQQQPDSRTIEAITDLSEGSGGTDCEGIESIRNGAYILYRLRDSVINSSDCKLTLENYPEISQAYAILWGDTLQYRVIKSDGTDVTSDDLTDFNNRLAKVCGMGLIPSGLPTSSVEITLNITVYSLHGFDVSDVLNDIKAWLEEYTDPLQAAKFGEGFILSDVLKGAVADILSVQNIVFTTVNGISPGEDVEILDYQIMSKIDWDNPSNIITVIAQ